MLCIMNPGVDAYFNAAAEEYLLRNFDEDVFALWRNKCAISVGKHQNALGEINLRFVKERGAQVSRRLSGGGAVYHDLGNLNFTFIRRSERGKQVDFRACTEPALAALNEIGAKAYFSGKSDLMIDGLKISGNAEHVWRDRTLHHGTLLFSTDLDSLEEAIKINPEKYSDKAVKSIRKRVTNISDHVDEDITIEEFAERFMILTLKRYDGAKFYEFTDQDIAEIEKLRDEKYATWDWNYGWTADYELSSSFMFEGQVVPIKLHIVKGIIRGAEIRSDSQLIRQIADEVVGIRHCESDIKTRLSDASIDPEVLEEIASSFF